MAKGTPSFGKHQEKTHTRCRRCGRHSYHETKGVCAACGYGKLRKLRTYGWQTGKLSGKRKSTATQRAMAKKFK